MSKSNEIQTYPNLSILARELNEYRYHAKKDQTSERFRENVNLVRHIIKELFKPNNEELINLLSYDAYKFFIESTDDIDALNSVDGFLDLSVTNKDNTSIIDHAFLTRYHDVEGTYYGSFKLIYNPDNDTTVVREYSFSKHDKENSKLFISTTINSTNYLEIIYVENGKLVYNFFDQSLAMTITEDNREKMVVEYKTRTHNPNAIYLFPEVFNKDYFKDYGVASRTRK